VKIVSSEEVYHSKIFTVTEDRAVDPDGFEIKRAIIQHPGAAVMLTVDRLKKILLVRQYRLPAKKRLWELPAGRIDPGETPLKAARRELKEETGYRALKWKKLVSFYPSPGYCAEKMTVYVATDLIEGEATPMGDERIECRWFTSKQIDTMIQKGQIMDGKTIAGYMVWRRVNCPFGR
jgi:ADP-ribose pyrophosphatase